MGDARASWVGVVAAGCLLLGCTGQIGEAGGRAGSLDPAGDEGAGDGDDAAGDGTSEDGSTEVAYAEPTLRRLTVTQYRQSVVDLIGLQPDVSGLNPVPPLNGLEAIGASTIAVAEVDVESFERLADGLSAAVFDDVAARDALVGCDAAMPSCSEAFVLRFGRQVFRRPLTDSERDRYLALLRTATDMTGDGLLGLRVVTGAMLQSPNFLYRVELGQQDPQQPGRRVLTDYEVASRLSYLLWNSTPDEALLDAAESGALATEQGLQAQALRLLESPRGSEAVESLLRDYLQLGGLEEMVKLVEVYPQMSDSLGAAMARETVLTAKTLAFDRDGDFRELFTTTTTFVDAELARLYGIAEPASGTFEEVQLPDDGPRGGLLTHGSYLASHAHAGRTSPTYRGKFLRESLLCQGIPPPPAGVDTTLPDVATAKTMRERLTAHREDPACASCHSIMDPPGLALENFDGIGAYRGLENGVVIDASGDLDGVTFDDARGLGEAVSQHPDLTGCFTRTLLRFARGQLENETQDPVLDELHAEFEASGFRMRDLMMAVVLHPSFRHVGVIE